MHRALGCSGGAPLENLVNHGARGHTTKIILWGSRSSIVISRRHKGEVTTSTTPSTITLVGAHPCLLIPKASAQLAMPPAQKPTGAEDAARALPREQPVTAAAVTPTPVNNESAGAEGAEFIAQDLTQDPTGNDDLLRIECCCDWFVGSGRCAT